MKRLSFLTALVLAASPAFAGPVVGKYVEARTAEVFAGGCIMSSEAETIGRQAVMAWRIDAGTYRGQVLDGLRVVAAVSGDRNLGIREIGGESPSFVRAVVYVDQRATDAQREALAGLARELSRGLITEVVQVTPVAISFDDTAETVAVVAGQSQLTVKKSGAWTGVRSDEVVHALQRRGQPGDGHRGGARVYRPWARCPVERAQSQVGVFRGVHL